MRIMFMDATLDHGGAERVISILANKLVERGHEVEILLNYNERIWYQIDERVRVTIAEKEVGSRKIYRQFLWRRKHIKTSESDVAVSFLAPFNMLNIITMIGIKIPLIVADRNDPQQVPINRVLRKVRDVLYNFADGVVLQNTKNKSYFSKRVQNKSAVIFNPIDLGDYEGKALIEKKAKKIVSVGRIIKQKNPALLINAFAKISDNYPDYTLHFYGDGDMLEEMQKKTKELNIGDKVVFEGSVSDVFEQIKDASLFVMTSNYEGMPNALLEAMCLGLPCISTNVSGAADVISNGDNGILINIGDENELVNKINLILSDSTIAETYAREAVRLSEELKVEKILDEWMSFIKKVKERQ